MARRLASPPCSGLGGWYSSLPAPWPEDVCFKKNRRGTRCNIDVFRYLLMFFRYVLMFFWYVLMFFRYVLMFFRYLLMFFRYVLMSCWCFVDVLLILFDILGYFLNHVNIVEINSQKRSTTLSCNDLFRWPFPRAPGCPLKLDTHRPGTPVPTKSQKMRPPRTSCSSSKPTTYEPAASVLRAAQLFFYVFFWSQRAWQIFMVKATRFKMCPSDLHLAKMRCP